MPSHVQAAPVLSGSVLAGLGWRHAVVPGGIVLVAALIVTIVAGIDATLVGLVPPLMAAGVILALAAPLAVLALMRNRWAGGVALGLVAGLFVVNVIGLGLPRIGFFVGLDWNWQGKTLDLLWCLVLIGLLSTAQREEIGWTWRTRPGTLPMALVNIVILVLAGFFLFGSGAPGTGASGLTLERVLFDTTYPNLVEEIVFRGFMLALLDRAFPPRWTVSGATIGWGVLLTSLLFGLVHGVSVGPEGAILFDPVWLAVSLVAGLVFGWIRALTGSLWPAFLAHCAPEIGVLFALWLV